MPIEPYKRGSTYWARGRVEYLSKPISAYYRCSTGASSEAGAWQWCRDEEACIIRRHLFGDDHAITFAEAVLLYDAGSADAGYLIPILERLGTTFAKDITPRAVRDIAPELYPMASTDTWVRQVVTPIRAVINNAHDLGRCPPIRVRAYTDQEQLEQDQRRGKSSREKKTPGSWDWLLKFRAHASPRHAALATFMFLTGARISQAIAMRPDVNLRLDQGRALVPAAKGHAARWVDLHPLLLDDLRALKPAYPRGAEPKIENLRVFGFADRSSPRKGWIAACDAAGIERLTFHAAGRHGFGQEMNIRQRVDEKAAASQGGWKDVGLMKRVYTHVEDASRKIHEAQDRGLRKAQKALKAKKRS